MENENKPIDEKTPVENAGEQVDNPNPTTPPVEGAKEEDSNKSPEDANKAEGQSKEEDSKFAKQRHERDIAKAKAAGDAEGYKRARIKSVGGKNPYVDKPIETDEDFEFYELQDEVKANGGDPNSPYEIEQLRQKKEVEHAKVIENNRSEQEKADIKAQEEVNDYLKDGHTHQELKEHWDNPKFMEFAEDLLGVIPLKSIIAKYDKVYPKENKDTKKQVANKVSSPGSSTNLEDPAPKKSIKDMTKDEFRKYMEQVEKGKITVN